MTITREGWGTLAGVAAFALLVGYLGFSRDNAWLIAVFILTVAIWMLVLYFFRDPQRQAPADPLAIISPADGRVVAVDTVSENRFFDAPVQRVAIFLSIFDVHINYVPFEGEVDFIDYKRGRYLPAYREEASTANQHVLVGLQTTYGKLAFKQSAGIVARRVVCHLRLGDKVKTGQKFGMIKFGSRVEVYFPEWAHPTVQVGQRVRAGESIVGRINENK